MKAGIDGLPLAAADRPQGLWISKKDDLADPSKFVKSTTVDFTPPPQGTVKATWLGHACVLVSFPPPADAPAGSRGVNVLFDPVFSVRCGPTQLFGAPKRYTREWAWGAGERAC